MELKDLRKGMFIVCNHNNLSGDIGKKYEVDYITMQTDDDTRRVIKVSGSRGAFKPNEIDWEKTAEINGFETNDERIKELEKKRDIAIGNSNLRLHKEEGLKHDNDKLMYELVPFGSLDEITKVLTYGCKKYKKDNWRLVENPIDRYKAATLRHLSAYMQGEHIDSESGISHLAHAGANILFLIDFEKNKHDKEMQEQYRIDDRQ